MKSIIDKEEWDFARIPLDQREACYLYEYERELTKHWPRLSQLFLIWKQRSILPKERSKSVEDHYNDDTHPPRFFKAFRSRAINLL